MLVVGLTGGIGSGKTTVAGLMAARGAVVVDADALVREVQAPGGPAHGPVVDRFGPGVVAADGSIDRAALASIAFADPAARADLEALTHPWVGRLMAERVAAHAGTDRVVVLEIPLLAERGREAFAVSVVVVVDCPEDLAVARLVAHRGLPEAQARARVAAQAGRAERMALADVVVDNSGSPDQLEAEVERAWTRLSALRPPGGVTPRP